MILPCSSGAAAENFLTPLAVSISSLPPRSQRSISTAALSATLRSAIRVRRSSIPHSPATSSSPGEVAMMVNWFGFATRPGLAGGNPSAAMAIAPIPSGEGCRPVSLSVFWALAMGSGSQNKELAWEFLRFIATAERDLGITLHGPVGVRLSTWRNPELQARIPVYRELEAISLGARQLPAGPHMADFAAVIDTVITRALITDAASRSLSSRQPRLKSPKKESDSHETHLFFRDRRPHPSRHSARRQLGHRSLRARLL